MNEKEMKLAERVSEILGKEVKYMAMVHIIEELAEVVDRYKKTLEFYANKENYECDDETIDPAVSYIHIVDLDEGYEARKALKGVIERERVSNT